MGILEIAWLMMKALLAVGLVIGSIFVVMILIAFIRDLIDQL